MWPGSGAVARGVPTCSAITDRAPARVAADAAGSVERGHRRLGSVVPEIGRAALGRLMRKGGDGYA